MKQWKQIMAAVFLGLVLLCGGEAATADGEFSKIGSVLKLVDQTAVCGGFVRAADDEAQAIVTVCLQELRGSYWTTIASWHAEADDDRLIDAGGSYPVQGGFSYRVVATGYLCDAEGNVLEDTVTQAVSEAQMPAEYTGCIHEEYALLGDPTQPEVVYTRIDKGFHFYDEVLEAVCMEKSCQFLVDIHIKMAVLPHSWVNGVCADCGCVQE